jgi:chromosomal replication initiation ATPase DnaA
VNSRKEKLNFAIAQAKQGLVEVGANASLPPEEQDAGKKTQRPKSRLNQLLGKRVVQDPRKGTLLQRVGVVERPTFDLVADAVLGKASKEHQPTLSLHEDDESLSTIVSNRLRNLRERTMESIEDQHKHTNDDDFFVGMEADGRPIWESVLDNQRGRKIHALPEQLAQPTEGSLFHHTTIAPVHAPWPVKLRPESRMSFKQWFTTEENLRATQAAEAIVDSPGIALNPLLILGSPESGRSHLLHAIAQGVLRRQEGDVFLLGAGDIQDLTTLPTGWQDALAGARLLAVDDAHLMADNPTCAGLLGTMIDYALNIGVHAVLTSTIEPERWPASRLWELLRSAASVRLLKPKPTSMVLYARQLALKRSLMLDDGQLASIVLHQDGGWRSTKANLDLVALALESGQELLDGEDVAVLLSGQPLQQSTAGRSIEREHVSDIATKLIAEAVDVVYSDEAIGGIDLHSPLPEIGADEYQPPEFDTTEMARNAQSRHESYMKTALQDLDLKVPSVLALHEREEHLVARSGRIEQRDYGTAAEILTDLDESIDRQIGSFEASFASRSIQLEQLEKRMIALSEQTSEASIEQLIQIADDLRHLEEELVEIDPDREPLPPFEEDTVKKKRKIGRRKKATPVEKNISDLDSFTPDGDWDVDASNIDMLDLLEDEPQEHRKIKLSTIATVQSSTLGEEE